MSSPTCPSLRISKAFRSGRPCACLLDDLQLKYVVHDGVLMITSPSKAESDEFMQTRVYIVDDLVLPIGAGRASQTELGMQADFQPLQDLLTQTVATKTWQENGGNGSTSTMIVNNHCALVQSQTEEVHEQVVDMLENLRRAGGLPSREPKLNTKAAQAAATPVAPQVRIRQRTPNGQGMGGGMGGGGMGGGMGGMGGGFAGGMGGRAGTAQSPSVISVIPTFGRNGPDLLEGVKGLNSANQTQKVMQKKSREAAGQMGGMGGGMEGRADFLK